MASKSSKRPLLVLSDSFSSRLFLGSGIVGNLHCQLDGDLDIVATFDLGVAKSVYDFDYTKWTASEGIDIRNEKDLLGARACSGADRFKLSLDRYLDKLIGYYPMTMHFNLKHGFMRPRMEWGHRNKYLDLKQGALIPRLNCFYDMMFARYYGAGRYIHPAITDFMDENTSCLLAANLQFQSTQPYVIAAKRMGLPIAGNIASWDHPVGKGFVYPGCKKYVVQNEYMKEVLAEYHGISSERVVITGWPQTDLFANKSPRVEYLALLKSYCLDTRLPCVLIAGNSANNAPYEPVFLALFLDEWSKKAIDKYSVIFRPHPKDSQWKERFSAIPERKNFHMQPASFSDIEVLASLLQNVDCVVTNAGTILLDSLVNDRAVVCVLYDEGAHRGSRFAVNNITGHHYQELMDSGSFHKAYTLDDTLSLIERSLESPQELRSQRIKICDRIIGKVDGGAGKRIADAMLSVLNKGSEKKGSI